MTKDREQELLQQIEIMKNDFAQERKGFGLMIRIRDEEIEKLKKEIDRLTGNKR